MPTLIMSKSLKLNGTILHVNCKVDVSDVYAPSSVMVEQITPIIFLFFFKTCYSGYLMNGLKNLVVRVGFGTIKSTWTCKTEY